MKKGNFDLKTLVYTQMLLSKYQNGTIRKDCLSVTCANLSNFLLLMKEELNGRQFRGIPDLNSIVIVPLKTAIKLNLYSGSWSAVKFISHRGNNQRAKLVRWVQVFVSSRRFEKSCYISQVLYHNVKTKMSSPSDQFFVEFTNDAKISSLYLITRIFALWNSTADKAKLISKFNRSLAPLEATDIDVAMIVTPQVLWEDSYEVLLKEFFGTPKYVCQGDILPILLPSYINISVEKYSGAIPPEYVYFEVLSASSATTDRTIDESLMHQNGFLVSNVFTNLYLKNSRTNKVPYIYPTVASYTNTVPPLLIDRWQSLLENCQSVEKVQKIISNEVSSGSSEPTDNTSEELSSDKSSKFYFGHTLLVGASGSGKTKLIQLLAASYSYHVKWVDCFAVKGDTSAATEAKLRQVFSKIVSYTIVVLVHIGCLATDREGNPDPRVIATLKEELGKVANGKHSIFVIGTAYKESDMNDELWSMFAFQEVLKSPSLEQRSHTLEWLLVSYFKLDFKYYINLHSSELKVLLDLKVLSHRTSGFNLGDLEELVVRVHRMVNVEKTNSKLDFSSLESLLKLIGQKCVEVLDEMQNQRSEALGLPKVPKVSWSDVGGLDQAKIELINTIQLPIKHPNLISTAIRRSGILLFGPPGTGKTLLAKSVASECGLNFLSVKGPELLNMYVGQSEENVREVFSKARNASPCVIFFDELDSLAPNRGRSGDSGGVMDRIVSALLAELDGVSSSSDVFVLGATNRPDLLDPALLRPGRFEKQIYLGVCETNQQQIKILRAVTSKLPLRESFDLEKIVAKLPFTLTGADFSALATEAFYASTRRVIQKIQKGEILKEEAQVLIDEEDFLSVAQTLVPSVSSSELQKYKQIERNRNL